MEDTNRDPENRAEIPTDPRELVKYRLKNSYFIVAGGAWHHLWENQDTKEVRTIGFNPEVTTPSSESAQELDKLKSSMQPEILKRFRDEVLFMPNMSETDFKQFAAKLNSKLPTHLREAFMAIVEANIGRAVNEKLAMRFFEAALSKAIMKTRRKEASPPHKGLL